MRARAILLPLLLLGLGAGLRAQDAALDPWQAVTLFDWCYPGEPGYQALQRAAALAGDQGWAAGRLRANLKLPQASARDLAQRLAEQEGLEPGLREQLKTFFADETSRVAGTQAQRLSDTAQDLSGRLEADAGALDRLEASLAANSYGKGSHTGVVLNLYDALRLDLPAGFDSGDQHAYLGGGLRSTLSGNLDKVNYQFSLSTEYFYDRLTGQDADPREDKIDAGVTFQYPLGQGGIDVDLGSTQSLLLSPLLFASYFPQFPDTFTVDVTDPYRAPTVTRVLNVAYPAGSYSYRGLSVKRQGFSPWWPFSSTQFIYSGDTNWWQSWSTKFDYTVLRLDEDLPWHNKLLDGGLAYAIGSSNGTDADALAGAGSSKPQQRSNAYGMGLELHDAWSGTLHFDLAGTDYVQTATSTLPVAFNHPDTGWLASLVQPLGAINVGLDLGQAGPWFLSVPHDQSHNQLGAVKDTYQVWPLNQSYPVGTLPDTWTTVMSAPGELSNNSQRAALKAEWHGNWISLGVYDGTVTQMQATDAFVETTPYLEGNQQDGYGFFRVFGQNFGAPLTAQSVSATGAPVDLSSTTTAGNMGLRAQALFNQPTDGTVIDYNGNPQAVHHQSITQLNDYEAEFHLLLTQGGVGDDHLMAPSVKDLNYAGGNLLLDFGALLSLRLPLQVDLVAELRDLQPQAGLPTLNGGSTGMMNQQYLVGYFTGGLSDTLTMVAMGGVETWRSNHGYYPLDIQVMEFGLGLDLKADPVVTGLSFNLRGTYLRLDDANFDSRQLVLSTVSLGSTLTY